jgi:hypothetical protein
VLCFLNGSLDVLVVILLILLIWLVLMGLLAAWTIWFQGFLYTEPVTQIYWRAPAVGSAITVFLIIWIFIDYRAVRNDPDAHFPYGPLQETAPSIAKSDTEPFPSIYVPSPGKDDALIEYKLEHVPNAGSQITYRHGDRLLESTPPKMIVKENGETSVFEPDLDAQHHFKRENGVLLYRDKKGRVVTEGPAFQRQASVPLGRFLVAGILNLFFLAVWFGGLWLLLRYHFWHSIGLAVVLWVLMLLFVVEPVMGRAERVIRDNLPGASVRSQS